MGSLHVLNWTTLTHMMTPIQLLRSPTHGLIIEFTALLLQLIITYIECVPAKAVVSHSHLISTSELKTRMVLVLIHNIVLMIIVSPTIYFVMRSCTKNRSIKWYMLLTSRNTIITVFSATICCIIGVNIVRVVVILVHVSSNYIF